MKVVSPALADVMIMKKPRPRHSKIGTKSGGPQKKGGGSANITEPGRPLKDYEDQIPLPVRPMYFYKYTCIDDTPDKDGSFPYRKHSSSIFKHNELNFRSASQFNDPFDCQFQVEFGGSKHDRTKFSETILKEQDPHLNRKELRSRARKEAKDLRDSDFVSNVRDEMRQTIETWGICCLSRVRNDILMWSHYANNHQGFCLEFSNDLHVIYLNRTEKRRVPHSITYSPHYPVADLVSSTGLLEAILTKAKQWDYEKEWRITIPGRKGPHRFPPQCLTGVIFGCRMSDMHKDLIRFWSKDREPVIKYYQAQEREDSYSLEIVKVS